jgi:DNA-binding CsgD family transcriptional regulator
VGAEHCLVAAIIAIVANDSLRGRGPFLGRSSELGAVRQRVAGVGGVVLLEGEAGIGKTRLLAEVLAERGGVRVVHARADELDRGRPFGLLVDALDCRRSSADPLSAEIARLIDEVAPEFRIVQRLSERLELLALEEPLILAVDDLQWADPSTVTALRFVTRHLRDVPVTFVVTLRPVPRDDALHRFLDSSVRDGALHVTLGPLDDRTVTDLVEDRLGLPPGPGLQSLVASAGGNPFYVSELLDALAAEGLLHTTGGAIDANVRSTPVAFRNAIIRYVRLLGEPQLSLLQWATVFGSRFSPSDLASVSGTPMSELLPVLNDAARAGILIDDRGQLAFRHDLLRSALSDDMGIAMRQSLHLEAARSLAAAGASPLEVAHHIQRTSGSSDDFAVGTLLAAADQTIHIGSKVELLTAALQRLPASDSRSVDVAVKMIVCLGLTGRGVDAEGLAARMQPTLTVRERARLSAALAAAYASQGDAAAALRHCDAIQDRALLEPGERSRLLINEGFALHGALRVDDAETVARLVIDEGTASNDQRTVATGRGLLCLCALTRGRGRDAAAMAVDVAKTWRGHGEFALQMSLINEDRFGDAEELFASTHEAVAERGHVTVQLQFQAANARAALLAGRLDDAEARSEAALSLAEQAVVHVPTAIAKGVLGRVALHRGAIPAAQTRIGSDQLEPALGVDVVEWVRALLLEAGGDPGGARRSLASAWDRLEPIRYFGTWPSIGSDLVRLHLRAGDRTGAEKVTRAIEVGAAGSDAVSAWGAALCCRALVEHDPPLIRKAVATYETGPRVLETAKAREDAASLLDETEAVAQLRTALATYEAVGATGDIARVRSTLRHLGVTVGTRGPRHRPPTGWSSLTPAEQRVVALAAEGLTTRQIGDRLHISSFTVDSHLRHVYHKLGINSRVQLTKEVIKHDAADSG